MLKNTCVLALVGLICFGSLSAFSQTDRQSEFNWASTNPSSGQDSDFAILNSGEKIFGKIIRNYNQAYYDQIVFEIGGVQQIYLPKDLKGFGLDNGQLFFSRFLPDSSELQFVQILVSGPIELSGYRGSFFLDSGEKYEKLEAYYKNVEVNDQTRRKFYKPFLVTLKTTLTGDCGVGLFPKIDKLPHSEQAFIGLLESYYDCQGTAYQVHVEKVPFVRISPTTGIGLSYFSLKSAGKSQDRNDQLDNNIGYQGFVGVRFHDFRNLPRVSADLRIGYSTFNTTVLSSYQGPQFYWTASEEVEETAFYIPVSFNYSVLKKQRSEIYLGISAGMWLKKIKQSNGIIDRRLLDYGETTLEEMQITEVMDSNFIPGIKVGYNLALAWKMRLFMELEANTQRDYYRFSLTKNEEENSRGRLSFQLGLEF